MCFGRNGIGGRLSGNSAVDENNQPKQLTNADILIQRQNWRLWHFEAWATIEKNQFLHGKWQELDDGRPERSPFPAESEEAAPASRK
jgi:hypothetical protein